MNVSKAFDVVPHKRLLSKLDFYGIRGCTLNWIDAFLSDRIQQVVIDGEFSDVATVTSGVPQGSVLGPILFLCFINDMPESVSSQVLKKARVKVTEMCKEAKQNFYQQKITENVGDQKVLFKVVNDLLYREKDTSLPSRRF